MGWQLAFMTWPPLLGLYLVFAGTAGGAEIATGLGLSALATGFALLVHAGPGRRLRPAPPPRAIWRPMLSLATDSARVGAVLLRAILRRPPGAVGTVSRQPFRHGGGDPRDAGRRGVVILSTSLAPNGYVLHLPEPGDALVLHRLAPAPPVADREWPG